MLRSSLHLKKKPYDSIIQSRLNEVNFLVGSSNFRGTLQKDGFFVYAYTRVEPSISFYKLIP